MIGDYITEINITSPTGIRQIEEKDKKLSLEIASQFISIVENYYDRLPLKAKIKVNSNIWELGSHSSGLMIRFRSNSEEIKVRYQTKNKNYSLNHMPATGSSGIDLYAIDADGKKLWVSSTFGRSFKDTIQYHYSRLKPNDNYNKFGREYRLYLPLYNEVEWLEIGVKDSSDFSPLTKRKEKVLNEINQDLLSKILSFF